MRSVLLVCIVLVTACTPRGPLAPAPSGSPAPSASSHPAALATGGIVEYPLPDATPDCGICNQGAATMALGPDGNIWFVEGGPQVVGRITPAGAVTYFKMPVALAGGAQTIAAGPDHNMWVLGRGAKASEPDWVLRLSLNGDVTKFPTPSLNAGTESIAAGTDGNLWFTEFWTSRVARITPAGVVTEYPLLNPNASPRGITAGPDGNLWFAEDDRSRPTIGRISPRGVQSEFHLGTGPTDATPHDIAVGPDGNLWITRWTGEGLGHISPLGQYVAVALPQGSTAGKALAGPDGNMWFADQGKNAIARITVTGVIREFPLPSRDSSPGDLAVGSDGRMWFSDGKRMASIGMKVPQLSFSDRVLIYADSSVKNITLTNTGDAALSIGGVKLTGADRTAFAVSADSCSGKSLDPGARCDVGLSHSAAGSQGVVQSALLEVADNATASPQRVSLVAQLRSCKLPIVESVSNQPPQGSMLDTTTGGALYEPRGGFATTASPPRVNTVTTPVLTGEQAGYYDRAADRWLPVPGATWVSPDGSRYVFIDYGDPQSNRDLHVLDVASGRERILPMGPGFWTVVAFTSQGIYVHQAYEGFGPGLWLVNPDTGSVRQVLTHDVVDLISGTTAWTTARNPADTLPQWGMGGGSNEVDTRDLVTGATQTWLYVPGSYVNVSGVYNGMPVVDVDQQTGRQVVVVTSPNQAKTLDLPFSNGASPQPSGFIPDPQGLWIGSPEGVYLWTLRTGGILVSTNPATPAGTCA